MELAENHGLLTPQGSVCAWARCLWLGVLPQPVLLLLKPCKTASGANTLWQGVAQLNSTSRCRLSE